MSNAANTAGMLLTANFVPSKTTGASGTAFFYLTFNDVSVYLYIRDLQVLSRHGYNNSECRDMVSLVNQGKKKGDIHIDF